MAEATISDALPEEYKDKQKAEYARESHKNREGSGQTTGLIIPIQQIENCCEILIPQNLAPFAQ